MIRSNRFHDSEDAIIVKDDITTGLVVENNRMVGWRGGCIQAQLWNTPGARVVRNTIWRSTCLGLRLAYDPAVGPAPTGIVVRGNIIDSYADGGAGVVRDQDYNLIVDGPRRGAHDSGGPARFGAGFQPIGVAAASEGRVVAAWLADGKRKTHAGLRRSFGNEPIARSLVAVWPGAVLEANRRLFDALEAAFPVCFRVLASARRDLRRSHRGRPGQRAGASRRRA